MELSSRKDMTFQRRENANGNIMKASYREWKMGAYVCNSRRAVYTYVTVGVVLYVPLRSLPISKEVKRVYRFLFHIQLSNSLNHTDYIFLSTSSKQVDTRRQK